METLVLTKFFGLYFFGIGLCFFFNAKGIKEIYQKIYSDSMILFFGGVIALLLGSFLVAYHNFWTFGILPLIITLLSWLSFFKGLAILIKPEWINSFQFLTKQSESFYKTMGIIWTGVGLLFIALGF